MEELGRGKPELLSFDYLRPGTKTGDVGERNVVMRDDLFWSEDGVASRRMAVGHKQNLVAEGQGPAYRGIDAELGVHSTDDQRADASVLQERMQFSVEEGIGRRLPNAHIVRLDYETSRKLPLTRVVLEVARTRLVLHEDHRHATTASVRGDQIDPADGALAVEGSAFTLTEALLNIDDEDGSVHGSRVRPNVLYKRRPTGAAGWTSAQSSG